MNKKVASYSILLIFILSACDGNKQGDDSGTLPEIVDFNFHIKPLLSDRCFACHGPDDNARKGDVRLDQEAFAYLLLDSVKGNYIIKPGDLGKSELYQRIINDDKEQMMPPLSQTSICPAMKLS